MVGFEPGLQVRAKLIGTEARRAWQLDMILGQPERVRLTTVTGAARHARGYGEQYGVPELTTAELPLDGTGVGYRLTVRTCGLAGGCT